MYQTMARPRKKSLGSLQSNDAITYTNYSIPEGDAGVRKTLCVMAHSLDSTLKHEPTVRGLTLRIVADIVDKNYREEVAAVFDWVRSNIRYTQDPTDKEMVQVPIRTLQFGQGDCDDHALLIATMLMSIGHECRFAVIRNMEDSESYDHVYTEVKIDDKWCAVDTTNKDNGYVGWEAPAYKKAVMELV